MTRLAPPLENPRKLFIGGEWVDPSSDVLIDVIAPATEELYMQVASAQESDVDRAVAAAREAFDQGPWPRMSHAERANYMLAMAHELAARTGDIASIRSEERRQGQECVSTCRSR